MEIEVLLSVVNLNKKDLDKMNINSKCVVINQCNKDTFVKYNNFNIYSYKEKGVSNSRNRALEHANGDILLFCDNDVVYNKDYDKIVINEFKANPQADVIFFNFESPNRKKRIITKRKRLHIYNSLNYATYNIAVRRSSLANIKFNPMFGPGAKFNNGSDTMFIVDLYKNKLKVYASPEYLGVVYNNNSTWFKGYNELYFFNKGALFTAVNPKIRHLLILQFLLRHRYMLTDIKLVNAYKLMLKGSKEYLNIKKKEEL
ncbi:MAG: glycosyltransferase family 2 protein [Bacilli bacterium]|nr:glycosyltransferase family 2 protein [Bacilli bacterium]